MKVPYLMVLSTQYRIVNQYALLLLFLMCFNVAAGPLEQAQKLHNRITGVPADTAKLTELSTLITNGDEIGAAYLAMETPEFYSVTLKHFSTPWTNIDQNAYQPLNDYSATVIGFVKDELDFRLILQADITYIGQASLGLPPYSLFNNNHYQELERTSQNFSTDLIQLNQSSLNGLPSTATAGVMTSRAAAKSFFYLGTNRAMLRFTLMNHLCTDLEPLKDNTRPPDRIRQDVSRSPGGDSRLFINSCSGCHSGMDPLAQAFAYYNYEFDPDSDPDGEQGQLTYNRAGQTDPITQSRVQEKYHINSTNFPYGYQTPNDNWVNYWREGINQKLGWDYALSGKGAGAKSLGEELANSEAFAQCQVQKVFKTLCLRDAESSEDIEQINATVTSFKTNSYQLKRVFAEIGTYCMGEE